MTHSKAMDMFKQWQDEQQKLAMTYIEKNIALLENNIQEFCDECPLNILSDVCKFLIEAGIDISEVSFNGFCSTYDALKNTQEYLNSYGNISWTDVTPQPQNDTLQELINYVENGGRNNDSSIRSHSNFQI